MTELVGAIDVVRRVSHEIVCVEVESVTVGEEQQLVQVVKTELTNWSIEGSI